jgi:hypothetical protein
MIDTATPTPTPQGNKENSADYLLFLIEERMCYYRRIIKEYLNEDINRMYSSSERLQAYLRLREMETGAFSIFSISNPR